MESKKRMDARVLTLTVCTPTSGEFVDAAMRSEQVATFQCAA